MKNFKNLLEVLLILFIPLLIMDGRYSRLLHFPNFLYF